MCESAEIATFLLWQGRAGALVDVNARSVSSMTVVNPHCPWALRADLYGLRGPDSWTTPLTRTDVGL